MNEELHEEVSQGRHSELDRFGELFHKGKRQFLEPSPESAQPKPHAFWRPAFDKKEEESDDLFVFNSGEE